MTEALRGSSWRELPQDIGSIDGSVFPSYTRKRRDQQLCGFWQGGSGAVLFLGNREFFVILLKGGDRECWKGMRENQEKR